MSVISFLKNKRNLSRDFRQEWYATLTKKPELTNPACWADGLRRLHEVQKNVKSDILKNLKTNYPENIKKEIITKIDSEGYEYQVDQYVRVTLIDKLRDLLRKKQKYTTKKSVMKIVHNEENSEISPDSSYMFVGKKVD